LIEEIVFRRVAGNLLEPDALDLLVDKCGGVLRDVFEVLLIAAETAHSLHQREKQPRAAINADNVRYALNRRKGEYARAISVIGLEPEWKVTIADLYARLRDLQDLPQRVMPSDYASMVLLQSGAIVEYNNGEQWFALHPLVRELVPLLPE
jgi:hypothetical protein